MQVSFVNDQGHKNIFKEKASALINKIKNWKIPSAFYYFLALVGIGIGFYFIMLIENNFSLAYGGDYSGQYIPMGYHVWDYYHEWIKTGHFTLFDPTVYLGVNSFGSNAYYGLFSPFNIIIVILPRSFVPQALGICSIIKIACAGLFFSVYMKHALKVKDTVARICGIAYAFAGWGAFYLWYNNYQDILVFFPLVLLGIEKVIQENKPWILCTGVFFLAICNYVLTIPYLICGFIYAMFRFFQQIKTKSFQDNMKILGFGVVGFAGGLIMSMLVFGPAVMATLSSPKLDSYSYFGTLKGYLLDGKIGEFFKLIFSWKVAPDQHGSVLPNRVFYPILEFFFPATTCRSLPTIQLQSWDFDDMAVSLWCYVPFILFLVPSLIQSGKDKKWSHFIAFGLIVLSLFTPFMYFLTMGFTNGYARWTLFVATSLIAYVGVYIDKIPDVAKWHIHIGYLFALSGIIAAWVLTFKLSSADTNTYGKYMHRLVIWNNGKIVYDFTNLAFILELLYTTAVYLVFFFTYNKKAFHIFGTIFVAFEAIVMGNLVTWGHGYDNGYNNGYAANERFKTVLNQVTKTDKSFYRIYTSIGDDWSVNNSLMNNYSATSFFHSLYNFEVDDFTLWTGMRSGSKSVGGNYRAKFQDLDNLLGIKYYFVSKKKALYNEIENAFPGAFNANVPFDFTESNNYNKEKSEYVSYINNYISDFGYSYTTLCDGEMKKYGEVETDFGFVQNAINLSTTPIVSKDDAEKIKSYGITIKDELENNDPLTSFNTMFNWSRNSYGNLFFNGPKYTLKHYKLEKTNDQGIIERINSYDFDVAKIPFIPTAGEYAERTYDGNDPHLWFAFLTSSEENQPLFKAGTAIYANVRFSGSEKYRFYFIDNNDQVFMCDSHDDDTTDNTIPMRGYYVNKDVKALAICGKFMHSYLYDRNFRMVYESKEDYLARREQISQNPIENVKYQKDKFTFETNYTTNRFVVSRVAYDKGWKIVAKDSSGKTQKINVYKGNGGFVSFVAPVGHYTYTMTYTTPYLTISYLVSALSVTGFFVSMVAYHIYQEKKKQAYIDDIYREN